ncbi:MAG: germination lipoprotein GerS-related protein [Sarcina sp.]
MSKKLSTTLFIILLITVVLVGGLAIFQKKNKKVTPEEVLKETLDVKEYATDITYIVKNARGQFEENGSIEYNKGEGTKITLENKEQTFNNEKIKIKYSNDEKVFEVDRDFDNFYRYLFINEISGFLRDENTISYNFQVIEDKQFLVLEFNTLSGNENIHKEKMLIDAKEKVPVEATIYDKNGNERIIVKYKNFLRKNKK